MSLNHRTVARRRFSPELPVYSFGAGPRTLGAVLIKTADEVVGKILTCFYPAFEQMTRKFAALAKESGSD